MEKCIFLDKDGTLIYDVPYNVECHKIQCYEDIYAPLKRLAKDGYKLIIVSNQSGLAKGYFKEDQLHEAFTHLIKTLRKEGIYITDYYFCPHANTTNCSCRKPLPGLLLQAAKDHQLDLEESWLIGDILSDMGAGRAAGCRTILLDRSGQERTLPLTAHPSYQPDYVVDNFFSIDSLIHKTKLKRDEQTDKQYSSRI